MKRDVSSNRSTNFDRLSRESLRREWNVLKFAWQMAKRYHFLLLVMMILEVILGVFPAVVIYFFQDAVSGAGRDILSLVTRENFVIVILVLFVNLLLHKIISVISTFAILDVEYNIRMSFLSKILALPVDAISGSLDNRAAFSMTRETAMTSGLIPMIYSSFLRAPVAIISAVVLLIVISPRMVALVSLMMAVIVGVSFLMRGMLKQFHREQNDAMSSLLQYFSEWLSGNRIYHVYGAEGFYEKKMTSTFGKISDVGKKYKLFSSAQSMLVEILTYVAIILFVVFLSEGDGYIDFGIVLSFPVLIMIIRGEILKLVGGYQQLATTESSISRLQTVLQMETPSDEGQAWNEQIESIGLRDLSYWYDDNTHIINHAWLKLEKGRLNVMTGPNGTGKSTTINLILGLLKPKEGCVCYNGKDIAGYTRASLLGQFAIVEQEPFVFQGTLLDNITLGRDISTDVVKDYLHKFALDYLIGESGDLSLKIGAKGRALSSGEKQRLALIRALAGEPSVIILDEPTSNIDNATATMIRDVMDDLSRQHLVICVSHDIAMINNNDFNIVQIENGNYVQRNRD